MIIINTSLESDYAVSSVRWKPWCCAECAFPHIHVIAVTSCRDVTHHYVPSSSRSRWLDDDNIDVIICCRSVLQRAWK